MGFGIGAAGSKAKVAVDGAQQIESFEGWRLAYIHYYMKGDTAAASST